MVSLRLASQELGRLNDLIIETVRVGRETRPEFVDVGGLLNQITLKQNHVVFGRRGSGKTTLLLSGYHRALDRGDIAVHFDSEDVKGNPYPDILIAVIARLLRRLKPAVEEQLSGIHGLLRFGRRRQGGALIDEVQSTLQELDKLGETPLRYEVTEERTREEGVTTETEARVGVSTIADIGAQVSVSRSGRDMESLREQRSFQREKALTVDHNLPRYKDLLRRITDFLPETIIFLILDDFYFLSKDTQPDVIDYLHRLVKGLPIYLKLGAIKYWCKLYRRSQGKIAGVELNQDIFPIELDRTLEDRTVLNDFFHRILSAFAAKAGIEEADFSELFTDGGRNLLLLASGGVPRDFLIIFVRSQQIAIDRGDTKIDKRAVAEAARRYANSTKRPNLVEDARSESGYLNNVLEMIIDFALGQKHSTVFLVNQTEAHSFPQAYDALNALQNLRFVHLVDPDTSASGGRPGRFEGYMLDAGLWAAPRPWHLVEVEFDRRDERSRKDQLRGCPILPLQDITSAITS